MLIPSTAARTALTVRAGWEVACARAMRGDARPRIPRLTPDEDAEDRAVDSKLRRNVGTDALRSRSRSDAGAGRGRIDE